MRRSGPLKSRPRETPKPDRAAKLRARAAQNARNAASIPAKARAAAPAAIASGTFRPMPKKPSDWSPPLRALAAGQPCLFRWQRGCRGDDGSTTALCHENRLSANKGGRYKGHDWRGAWGCAVCHREFDQGQYAHEVLDAVFDAAWRRQLIAWLKIAQNPSERPRARSAAAWALARSITWLEEHEDGETARVLRDAWDPGAVLPVRALSVEDVRCVLRRHVQGREK